MTWRWPWVSRALYDGALRDAERLCDLWRERKQDAQQELATLKAMYADLLARYHMLKLQGAVVVEPAQPREVPKADALKDALAVASRGNQNLLRQMMRAVEQDRAAGLTDEQIIRRIKAGNRVQAEFADAEVANTTSTPSADPASTP